MSLKKELTEAMNNPKIFDSMKISGFNQIVSSLAHIEDDKSKQLPGQNKHLLFMSAPAIWLCNTIENRYLCNFLNVSKATTDFVKNSNLPDPATPYEGKGNRLDQEKALYNSYQKFFFSGIGSQTPSTRLIDLCKIWAAYYLYRPAMPGDERGEPKNHATVRLITKKPLK